MNRHMEPGRGSQGWPKPMSSQVTSMGIGESTHTPTRGLRPTQSTPVKSKGQGRSSVTTVPETAQTASSSPLQPLSHTETTPR
ncbi:rCG31533, isoform CRA_c [Rattus norvegicus]|uniref:RCG31533, isoform CRA_c n=1 Tax=Rattus norvegicus TaxID=10116 RepID=A6IU96_RAT|nr:rCG31533, isoform CRA_c [Rattus norvegicus]